MEDLAQLLSDLERFANQALRCGTAAAPQYAEARGAESRADFIHKLKVVFKELNETTIWLEVIAQSSLLSPEIIAAIVAENRELCRIIAASIKTARGRNHDSIRSIGHSVV